MQTRTPPSPPDLADRDTTRDTSTRFAGDQKIRDAGFVIASRPGTGEAVWRHAKTGTLYTESEVRALLLLRRSKLRGGLAR